MLLEEENAEEMTPVLQLYEILFSEYSRKKKKKDKASTQKKSHLYLSSKFRLF